MLVTYGPYDMVITFVNFILDPKSASRTSIKQKSVTSVMLQHCSFKTIYFFSFKMNFIYHFDFPLAVVWMSIGFAIPHYKCTNYSVFSIILFWFFKLLPFRLCYKVIILYLFKFQTITSSIELNKPMFRLFFKDFLFCIFKLTSDDVFLTFSNHLRLIYMYF